MVQLLKSRLSPFKHRSFRNFFFVQSLSLIGQWSHDLARAWIVLELLGKAGALGSLMLAVAIPTLFLMPRGGVLVDRINAKKLMMVTKSILAVSSLGLAFITEFGEIQMWHLLIFALLEGITISFDSPAYQTLTVRLVPKEDFQQAVALNTTNFHGARMIGPIVAGLLMAWHGPSAVFFFDAISYFLLVFILSRTELLKVSRKLTENLGFMNSLIDGFKYMLNDQRMRFYVFQLFLTVVLVFPILVVVLRTYVKLKFDLDSDEFGYVFAFPAAGALLGSLVFTALKPKEPSSALKFGVPGAVTMMMLIPSMESLYTTVAAMTFGGFFTFMCFASLTVSIHLYVQEEYRGRMGSLVGLAFVSIGPLMGFPIGVFADYFGYDVSIYIFISLFGLFSFLLFLLERKRRLFSTNQ